jgi:hypothetical protein
VDGILQQIEGIRHKCRAIILPKLTRGSFSNLRHTIQVTNAIIVEVTSLPNKVTQWIGKYIALNEVVESFAEPGEEFNKKGKGLNHTTLSEPWRELAGVIQRYMKCKGRYHVMRPCHLKLLATLKQRSVINLPFFFNTMLHEVTGRT